MTLKINIIGRQAPGKKEHGPVDSKHELGKGEVVVIHTRGSNGQRALLSVISGSRKSDGGRISGDVVSSGNEIVPVEQILLSASGRQLDRLHITQLDLGEGQIIDNLGLPPHRVLIAGHAWVEPKDK